MVYKNLDNNHITNCNKLHKIVKQQGPNFPQKAFSQNFCCIFGAAANFKLWFMIIHQIWPYKRTIMKTPILPRASFDKAAWLNNQQNKEFNVRYDPQASCLVDANHCFLRTKLWIASNSYYFMQFKPITTSGGDRGIH